MVIKVKSIIAKMAVTFIVYYFLFQRVNENIYENFKLPWFIIDNMTVYFTSFFIMCINMFSFSLLDKKRFLFFLIILIMYVLYFTIDNLYLLLIVLYGFVLFSGYIVNFLYRENKASGYLLLINLFFVSYLLATNQMIALLN